MNVIGVCIMNVCMCLACGLNVHLYGNSWAVKPFTKQIPSRNKGTNYWVIILFFSFDSDVLQHKRTIMHSNSHKAGPDKSLLQNLYTRVTTIRPHSLRLPEVNVSRPVHLVLEGIVQSI